MKIFISSILLFSSTVFGQTQFQTLGQTFDLAQNMKVVEIPDGKRGTCFTESDDSFKVVLIVAHKSTEQNQGPGNSRTLREYAFGIYALPILSFKAQKLLLERDWEKLDVKKGLDLAETTYYLKEQPVFYYFLRQTSGAPVLQVSSAVTRKIEINGNEIQATEGQTVLNCQF